MDWKFRKMGEDFISPLENFCIVGGWLTSHQTASHCDVQISTGMTSQALNGKRQGAESGHEGYEVEVSVHPYSARRWRSSEEGRRKHYKYEKFFVCPTHMKFFLLAD